jgi:hypothetical protein
MEQEPLLAAALHGEHGQRQLRLHGRPFGTTAAVVRLTGFSLARGYLVVRVTAWL